MNDKDILLRLLQQANLDDALTQPARKEYEKLVARFDDDGLEQEFSVNDLNENLENAVQNLSEAGYIAQAFHYYGLSSGHSLRVNLRGEKFQELASGKHSITGMNDSGKREVFATGAVRDSAEGKPRPDLFSPFAMERIGLWLEQGARKYEPRNWEKGMGYERVTASLHRHLMKYMQHDMSEDHLAAIAVNASFLMHYDAMIERGILPKELNDLPEYESLEN